MLNFRFNFIFAPIRFAVKLVFKIIYKILSLFHLQLFLFVGLVGIILWATGVLDNYFAVRVIFLIVLFFSVAYALVMTVRSLLGLNKKKNKKFGAVEVVEGGIETPEVKEQPKKEIAKAESEETGADMAKYFKEEKPQYPKYFAVKNRPDYVMAEYEDRYVLYLKTGGVMKMIRQDFKNK